MTRLTLVTDFKHVQEKIFFGWQGRSDFNTPTSGYYVLTVGAENLVEILTPKQFPSAPQFGIIWQRTALSRLEGPVFSRFPRSSVVVSRSIELDSLPSAPGDHALLGKKRVHEQLA